MSTHHWRWWRFMPPLRPFNAFVLSHHHADHYNGLLHLASKPPTKRECHPLLGPEASFFHPRLPRTPEAGELVMRLAALNSVMSGIPEYALSSAVRACAAGR